MYAIVEGFTPWFTEMLDRFRKGNNQFYREIVHEKITNYWGSNLSGKDERNYILQKAITLYLGEMEGMAYKDAKYSLSAVKEKGKRDNETYEMTYGSTFDQLKCYSISTMPQNGKWVKLKEGLEFMKSTSEDESGEENKTTRKKTITFHFKSNKLNGEEMINNFVNECFDWYKERMESLQDDGRYLYMMVPKASGFKSSNDDEGGGEETDTDVKYKRYRLSDEKTFESLFFSEKENLLKLLDHFTNKSGKYAINGFPHKLGLLLHGPPGTGKTSLIKALAHYTKRNVVSIPLGRIKTNQELMDVVFDQTFPCNGEDMPIKMSFKDIIFVMEDVDAASPVVHKRSGNEKKSTVVKLVKEITTTNNANQATKEGEEDKEDGGELETKDGNVVESIEIKQDNDDGNKEEKDDGVDTLSQTNPPNQSKITLTRQTTIDGETKEEEEDDISSVGGGHGFDTAIGPMMGEFYFILNFSYFL